MTLVQLRQFIALAQIGSFVKASNQLFMTQPALSRSIKALEEELGQLLFDRIGKRIELTVFGRDVLRRSQALVEEADQLKHSGKRLSAQENGRVRLGLGSGPGAILTAPVISHFARNFPRFYVEILRSNTASLVQMLRQREVDAIVVDIRSMIPSPDLSVTQVAEMDGVFMCRDGHPIEHLGKIGIKQLSQYPVASTPLSEETARILIEHYGEAAHPEVLVKFQSDELSHLIQVTKSTDTILLAIRSCAPELNELKLSPPLKVKARFGLVTIAQKAEPLYLPEIRKLMEAVMH